jgi:DNA polymerase
MAGAELDWSALAQTVSTCNACGLCAARKNTTLVPLPTALSGPCDWLVLGDPPDADEDRTGSPFAGADGVLLGNMLAALGVQRVNFPELPEGTAPAALPAAQRAYVTNVVKCRPAHGQSPQAAELAQCAVYLQREIALVRPKMILAMGRFAQQWVLSEDPALAQQPLGKLRGVVHRYHGVDVVLSYHPKALMRNSADKGKAWADLCLAADTVAAPR